MTAKNGIYNNFVLESMIEELVASKLDLQPFATPDNTLQGTPGMEKHINRYTATDGTQKLGIGEGNTKTIVASFVPEVYRIQLAQNRAEYYDEEMMTDPIAIETLVQKQAAGLFDQMNADVYGEWEKTGIQVDADETTGIFAAFVEAEAWIHNETLTPGEETFAIVNPHDLATIRVALGENLKYVESFARQGYIGTVGGCNLYVKRNAKAGKIYMATREAVKIFYKTGSEVEVVDNTRRDATDANVRLNTMFARKYYVAALVDATKVVEISIPSEPKIVVTTPAPTIGVGDTLAINTMQYGDGTVSFASGTTAKATVSSTGVVTGVAAGTATITATLTVGSSNYTDTVLVTVE